MDTADGIMGTNMYAYCNNDPTNKYDPSGLAPASIHDRKKGDGIGTYYWSLEYFKLAGIKDQAKSFAETFAKANISIDEDPSTTFYNPLPSAQRWHFNIYNTSVDSREAMYSESYARAEAFAAAGDIDGVLEELGKGLHALQDKAYHNGFLGDISLPVGELLGIPSYSLHVHWPKFLYKVDGLKIGNPKYMAAQAATWRVLADFVELCNKYPGLPSLKIPTASQLSKIL